MMSSFLGCDRMSRTDDAMPPTFTARSSCETATRYGLGLPCGAGGDMVSARDGSSIVTRIAVGPEHRKLDPALRVMTLEIAAEARAEWGYASDIIARTFRDHRELSSGGRRRVAEAVYGLIRWDRRLDAILAALPGAPDDLSPVARDELKLLVHEIRDGMPVEAAEPEL